MVEIILMRHGKPVLTKGRWLAPFEMARWIEHYDRSEVEAANIPAASAKAATSASVIVSSTAARALSSVQALGYNASTADKVFCEAALPFSVWRFPYLPPHFWAAFFRLLWFFGYSRGVDSVHATRECAKVGAQKLIYLAQNGSVLLIGHGIMNRLIAKELAASGWVPRTRHDGKYWSTMVFALPSLPTKSTDCKLV